jgi:hypothetical protein
MTARALVPLSIAALLLPVSWEAAVSAPCSVSARPLWTLCETGSGTATCGLDLIVNQDLACSSASLNVTSSTPGFSFAPSPVPVGVGPTSQIDLTVFGTCKPPNAPEVTLSLAGCGGSCAFELPAGPTQFAKTGNCCTAQAVPQTSTLCAGGSTIVSLKPPPSGSVVWYEVPNCSAPPPPATCGSSGSGWLPLGRAGTVWDTLGLFSTTCYCATASNVTGCPNEVVSGEAVVTVTPAASPPTVQCVPSGSCSGDLCGPVTPTLQATGFGAGCTLQWQQLGAGGWADIPGQTSTLFQPGTLTGQCPSSTFSYRVVPTCACPVGPSNTVSLTVFQRLTVGTLSATNTSICAGQDDKVTLAPPPCPGEQVEWESASGTVSGPFTNNLPGANGASVWNTNLLTTKTSYEVQVSNGGNWVSDPTGPCAPATSNPVIIAVTQPAVTIVAKGPTSFCFPGKVQLAANASPAGGTYQWFHDGLPLASGSTINATQSGKYWVVYTASPCDPVTSNVITVVVDQPVATILGPCGICQPGFVILDAVEVGGVAPDHCLWTLDGNQCTRKVIKPGTYSVTVTDSKGCTAKAQTTVVLCHKFTVNAGAARAITKGQSTVLGGAPTVSGGTAPYTYAWSPPAPSGPNPTVTPATTTTYTVTVTDKNGCTGVATVTVTVH